MKTYSIKRTKKDIKANETKYDKPVSIDEADRYPWGFTLDFNDEALEKVPGVSDLEVGDKVKIVAKGFVKSKSVNESEGEKTSNLCIQITRIGVSDTEDYDSAFKEGSENNE